jgi:probable F420-dependent oxidoreductase
MKFGIGGINSGAIARPENVLELARAAEQLGFESIWPFEHICVPLAHGPYAGTPDGQVPGGDRGAINEPLLQLAYVASATSRIRLATGALILPLHHPLYLAKQLATLDTLSHGRVLLGVVNGWMNEEYRALGIDWKTRGRRTEEAIAAMRALWREDAASFHGRHFNFDQVYSFPKPVQKNGIPILIGGVTRAAARRAARIGDGYYPIVPDPQRLKELLAVMRVEARGHGRNPDEIEVTTGLPSADLDAARRLAEMGISRIILRVQGSQPEEIRAGVERLAEQIVRRW